MQRRIALSLSLAITTIVTFALVAVGAQAGFFSEHKTAKADEIVAAAPAADASTYAAPADTAPAPAEEGPFVVTDYVYIDEPGAPVGVRGTRAASRPATPAPAALKAASKATAQSQPAATAQPAAAIPTQAAPESTATEPPAPTSTPPPAAAPTQPPVQPGPPPAPSQPKEIEFTGTVTDIDGNTVTFAYRGTSTPVTVTKKLSDLEIGTRAKVHARLSGVAYIATEIEVGGD
jgi:hypothetical protein